MLTSVNTLLECSAANSMVAVALDYLPHAQRRKRRNKATSHVISKGPVAASGEARPSTLPISVSQSVRPRVLSSFLFGTTIILGSLPNISKRLYAYGQDSRVSSMQKLGTLPYSTRHDLSVHQFLHTVVRHLVSGHL